MTLFYVWSYTHTKRVRLNKNWYQCWPFDISFLFIQFFTLFTYSFIVQREETYLDQDKKDHFSRLWYPKNWKNRKRWSNLFFHQNRQKKIKWWTSGNWQYRFFVLFCFTEQKRDSDRQDKRVIVEIIHTYMCVIAYHKMIDQEKGEHTRYCSKSIHTVKIV